MFSPTHNDYKLVEDSLAYEYKYYVTGRYKDTYKEINLTRTFERTFPKGRFV